MAKIIGGLSVLAAIVQSVSIYREAAKNSDFSLCVRKLAKSWAWLTGSIAVACLAVIPLLNLAGWVLGLVMVVVVIPVATFTMAVAAPIPWGLAASVTGLLHASGQVGIWFAGAQLPEGDRILFADIFIWNTVAVSIAAYYRWQRRGAHAPNHPVQQKRWSETDEL